MKGLVRVVDAVAVACAVAAAVLLFAAVLVVTWMVIWRTSGHSTFWELESAVYLMVAAVFLGSPYCLKTGGHVGVDLLGHYLPAGPRRAVDLVVIVLGLAVCLYLTKVGIDMVHEAVAKGETTGSLWNPPKWPLYLTMPVGLGLTALQYLAELVRALDKGRGGRV